MPDTRYSRSTADAARDLKRRGFEPTPLNGKQPTKDNWQNRTIPDELYDTEFEGKNPGVVLGARSGGLVDVDLDHGLAVKLASSFLSPSDCTFGRASKPE